MSPVQRLIYSMTLLVLVLILIRRSSSLNCLVSAGIGKAETGAVAPASMPCLMPDMVCAYQALGPVVTKLCQLHGVFTELKLEMGMDKCQEVDVIKYNLAVGKAIVGGVGKLGMDGLKAVVGGIKGGLGGIRDAAGNVIELAKDGAGNLVGVAKDAAGNVIGIAGNLTGGMVGGVKDAAGNLIDGAGNFTGNMVGGVRDAAGNLISGVGDAVEGLPGVGGLANATKGGLSGIKNGFTSLFGRKKRDAGSEDESALDGITKMKVCYCDQDDCNQQIIVHKISDRSSGSTSISELKPVSRIAWSLFLAPIFLK